MSPVPRILHITQHLSIYGICKALQNAMSNMNLAFYNIYGLEHWSLLFTARQYINNFGSVTGLYSSLIANGSQLVLFKV